MVRPPVEVSKEHWGEYIECDGDKASWGRGDKEADEDRRTGAFAKIFWLSCALMRRYGGPNGIRTRVTDVRGLYNSTTDFHALPKTLIFLHSIPRYFHKLPRVFTDRRPKGDPVTYRVDEAEHAASTLVSRRYHSH